MKPSPTGFLAAALACLAPVAVARAQPLGGATSSVEWLAAQAPLIVRGVIEEVAAHDPGDGFHRYQTVSVRVLETVRGPHLGRLQFVQDGDFGPVRIRELRDREQPVLLFLDEWARSPRFRRPAGGYAYARFPYLVEHLAVLDPGGVHLAGSHLPTLRADLTVVSTPEQLVAAIRAYLDRPHDRPVRPVTTRLPPGLRGSYIQVEFAEPDDARPDEAGPALDFATFKGRFGKAPPATRKPPYTRGHGRDGHTGSTALELLAADCDAIVRGVVADWCFVADSDGPIGPSCGIRLRVAETLKGEAAGEVSFLATDAPDLEALRATRREIVAFLDREGPAKRANALPFRTRAPLWVDSAIVLDRDRAEVPFADLTWHREPGEILDRLGAAARRLRDRGGRPAPGPVVHRGPPVFAVNLPPALAAGLSVPGHEYPRVSLPVDADLEANARRWAAADGKDLRWLAARALVYFKSDENARLLRGLLGDEATWDARAAYRLIEPLYNEDPRRLVRWEAWHVLDGWGYPTPKPDWGEAK